MIRILHVIGAMNRAGAETLVMNIYRKIDRTRFQFDFLVHTKEKCDYDDEILTLGGKIYRISPFNGVNIISYKKELNKHFSEHPEHNIIHNHMTSTAYVVSKQAHKFHRYSIIHTHSKNFYKGIQHLAFSIAAFPLRFVGDYFLACSTEAAVNTFGAGILDKDTYTTLHNAIDLSSFYCTNKEHITLKENYGLKNCPVFGHVGRFVPEKNHDFLIESFFYIKKSLPNAILLLAGKGSLEDKIKEKVQELGIDDSVYFIGVSDKIDQFLKLIDVFIFPSINEGLGLAAIEAQAAGATCVLSKGLPDLALIVSSIKISLSLGPQKWAEVSLYAYNRSLINDRKKSISAIAEKGFDILDVRNQLLTIYKNALSLKLH